MFTNDLRAAFPLPISLRRPPRAEERPELREIPVGEVMSWGPVTISADDPLAVAARRMVERRIGCLPVLDDSGALAGILTESDLLEALVTMLWTEELRDNDISYRTVIEAEDPRTLLSSVAVAERADVIVVGSRGHSQIRELLLGSVAEFLTHHARVPVVVIPVDAELSLT